jgi:hypothetical protein
MNGRKLFRQYAQSKGKEAKEFVKIEQGWYAQDILHTKDFNGNPEKCDLDYKEMIHWIIKTQKLTPKK